MQRQPQLNSLINSLYKKPDQSDLIFDIEKENGGLERTSVKVAASDPVVLIEGSFRFFEIENLLRTICFDTYEPLRVRMGQEAEAGKQARKIALDTKGELSEVKVKIASLEQSIAYMTQLNRKVDQLQKHIDQQIQQQSSLINGIFDKAKGVQTMVDVANHKINTIENGIQRYDTLLSNLQKQQFKDREALHNSLNENQVKVEEKFEAFQVITDEQDNKFTKLNADLLHLNNKLEICNVKMYANKIHFSKIDEQIETLNQLKINFSSFIQDTNLNLQRLTNTVDEQHQTKQFKKEKHKQIKKQQEDKVQPLFELQAPQKLLEQKPLQINYSQLQLSEQIQTNEEIGSQINHPDPSILNQQSLSHSRNLSAQDFIQQNSVSYIQKSQSIIETQQLLSDKTIAKQFQRQDQSVEIQNQSVEKSNISAKIQNKSIEIQNQSAEIQNQSAEIQKKSVKMQNKSANIKNQSAEMQIQSAEIQKQSVKIQNQSLKQQNQADENHSVKMNAASHVESLQLQNELQELTKKSQHFTLEVTSITPLNQYKKSKTPSVENSQNFEHSQDHKDNDDSNMDTDELQDIEDSNTLGIDVTRFKKQKDLDRLEIKFIDLYQQFTKQINQRLAEQQEWIEKTLSKFNNKILDIDPKILKLLAPMTERIEILLQSRAHWRSDDERKSSKLCERFAGIEKEFAEIKNYVDKTISPIAVCILEQINIQISCEEQDTIDRKKMALYGISTNQNHNETTKAISLLNNSTSDQTVHSTSKILKLQLPAEGESVKLDNECISHKGDVHKVTKLFKLACLSYKAGDVTYRNQTLSKDKMLMMRKFLAGQCMFIVKESQYLQNLFLSPRRIFDDVDVHFQGLTADLQQKQSEQSWMQINFQHKNLLLSKLSAMNSEQQINNLVDKQVRLIQDNSNLQSKLDFGKTQKQQSVQSFNETVGDVRVPKVSVWDDSIPAIKQMQNSSVQTPNQSWVSPQNQNSSTQLTFVSPDRQKTNQTQLVRPKLFNVQAQNLQNKEPYNKGNMRQTKNRTMLMTTQEARQYKTISGQLELQNINNKLQIELVGNQYMIHQPTEYSVSNTRRTSVPPMTGVSLSSIAQISNSNLVQKEILPQLAEGRSSVTPQIKQNHVSRNF